MKKNDIITLKITDLNSEGAGVGRYEGQVVFVPYALPDETVEALIIKLSKTYAVGKLLNVLTPSQFRIEPECPYFYKCGGCDFQHLDYKEELNLKCNSTIKNIQKLSGKNLKIKDIVGADKLWNYRNKAQFPIAKDKDGNVILGFFSPRSHRVVSVENCMLQEEKCNSIISDVKSLCKKHHISIYDEVSHKGILRHVIARSSNEGLMVILVTNSKKILPVGFINDLVLSNNTITTVVQNFNCEKGNIILGKECVTLYGDGFIFDNLCDIKFKLGPLAFLQVNHLQAEKLYNIAVNMAELSGNEIVFDAYCGIGVMSLMLAKKSKKVIGVEIVPEAITTAKETAKINDIDNAEFFVGACEDVLPRLLKSGQKPDVLVVDPPRAGCEESLLNAIAENGIEKIVYVSCNPATLARDIKVLGQLGYTSSDVTFVDMFCHTKHIETVALLSRKIDVHKMNLNSSPFEMIKSGEKTIELRLYDEKRQQVKTGDKIIFTNTTTGEKLNTTVVKLHKFDSFKELYKSLSLLKCGYTAENVDKATPSDMEQYYTVEEQRKYGVVGIELCRPKKITDDNEACLNKI